MWSYGTVSGFVSFRAGCTNVVVLNHSVSKLQITDIQILDSRARTTDLPVQAARARARAAEEVKRPAEGHAQTAHAHAQIYLSCIWLFTIELTLNTLIG